MSITMPCPVCSTRETCVVDSRPHPQAVRRRRECKNGHRFRTYERVGDDEGDRLELVSIGLLPEHIQAPFRAMYRAALGLEEE